MDRCQRYIFFLQRQGPGTTGWGRVLSLEPGKGLDNSLQAPPSCSPLPRAWGRLRASGPRAGVGPVGS